MVLSTVKYKSNKTKLPRQKKKNTWKLVIQKKEREKKGRKKRMQEAKRRFRWGARPLSQPMDVRRAIKF